MVSNIDTAKRALVALLKSLAGIYSLVVGLTRESADAEVRAAYKQVARKAHPDKGGAPEHQKALNAARDTWEDALRAGKGRGGDHMPKASAAKSATAPVNVSGNDVLGFFWTARLQNPASPLRKFVGFQESGKKQFPKHVYA